MPGGLEENIKMKAMVDNLNKENFWDKLHERFPEAVDHFCKWIDEYKKEVKWDALFNGNLVHPNMMNGKTQSPKFHDLPFDMQNGIIARYELELFNNGHGKGKEAATTILENYKSQVEDLFKDLQLNINKRKPKLN